MYGEYTVCAKASDPQGNQSSYDAETPCTCAEANAKPQDSFDCQCINFMAYPREDIRIELTWENLGPDLDLSVAGSNAHHLPSDEAIERIRQAGVKILRTDSDGAVTITTDGHDLELDNCRP